MEIRPLSKDLQTVLRRGLKRKNLADFFGSIFFNVSFLKKSQSGPLLNKADSVKLNFSNIAEKSADTLPSKYISCNIGKFDETVETRTVGATVD